MMTRRDLLELAALMGGIGGVLRVAHALELLPPFDESTPLQIAPARVQRRVVILGAGIAGLVSAFELQRNGYQVEVLESAPRIGGRVLTLRHGDVIDEIGNRQICQFDAEPHLYFNAGASRIPATHRRLLGYCRELGIKLETHVNVNVSAWMQNDDFHGGQRLRIREYQADARGFLAELIAKSLSPTNIDRELDGIDRQRLLDFFAQYGDLGTDRRYHGSLNRAGALQDGLYIAGKTREPIGFAELLKADFWQSSMHFGESQTQSSVLQPVGGMDRIVEAFAAPLGDRILREAQVIDIRTSPERVTVTYRHRGQVHTTHGDYCLNSIPGQLLTGIDNNFSAPFRANLATRPRGKLAKIAFQMNQRFWEEEGIYGGISWTGRDIGQIQYPSHAFHERKGIVIGGYYLQQDPADRFHVMSAQQRIDAAIAQGTALHPNYARHVENGVSVAWYRMNHMLGCSARDTDAATLEVLRQPEGRHLLIGDQVSAHAGWQEAAVLSAHHALNRLNAWEQQA
jgi:monoamine oxidase